MTKARDLSLGGGASSSDLATTNTAVALKAPLASPVFTGNVGIGSALLTTTASNMLQLGSTSNLAWYNQGDDELDISVNSINNSGNKYIEAKAASQYIQHAATHYFNVAPSGTAGAAISWNTAMTITNAGFIGIGETSPVDKVHIKQNGDIGACLRIDNSNTSSAGSGSVVFERNGTVVGTIQLTGSATIYGTSSDYRLKENVTPMSGATAKTKLLKPCNFNWINFNENTDGFLAHELAEIVPDAVYGTKDAMRDEEYEVTAATDTEAAVMGTRSVPDLQGIDQSKLVPLLTATIQELIARIEALEA